MTRTRRLFFFASALVTAMAMAAACGFPDPALVGIEGGPPEASTDGLAHDGTTPDADTGDSTAPPDSALLDVHPSVDATDEKPAVEAGCNPCDCDNDGFVTKDAAVCPDAGGKPRGDCDDYDYRAHPDAGYLVDQPTTTTLGDWNCDGVVNGEYNVDINCADYGGVLFSSCSSTEGFTGNPNCGQAADYVKCMATGLSSCGQGTVSKTQQGCK